MRAAIYNPYLDTLGGGERYTMAIASSLAKNGYRVDVEWENPKIKEKLEKRFGIILDDINFIPDIKKGDGYDLCFWISDGSIPNLKSRNNYLHFQVPFHDVSGRSLLNRMKLFRIKKIICNSKFTKKIIDGEFGVSSVVLYPPVSVEKIKPKRKENIILGVARFSQLVQSKRHDILIDSFKKLCREGLSDWQLILAGGIEVGVGDYLSQLEKRAKGYPILFVKSPKFSEICELYGKAKIFWSAAGFEINEEKEPEKTEHFGISVVEAMAAKAVPIIFAAGGHREVVDSGQNGFLWQKLSEFKKYTKFLIEDSKELYRMATLASEKSKNFSYERFDDEFKKIIT